MAEFRIERVQRLESDCMGVVKMRDYESGIHKSCIQIQDTELTIGRHGFEYDTCQVFGNAVNNFKYLG